MASFDDGVEDASDALRQLQGQGGAGGEILPCWSRCSAPSN